MTTTEDLQNMEGQTAVDMNGAKLGKIGQIYVDDQTGQPLWVTITTGMFGTKQSFAPLHGSRSDGGALHLAVTKDMVTDAPGVEADGHIEDAENEALYTYYNGHLGETAQGQYQEHAGDAREDLGGRDGIQGQDTSGPNRKIGPESGGAPLAPLSPVEANTVIPCALPCCRIGSKDSAELSISEPPKLMLIMCTRLSLIALAIAPVRLGKNPGEAAASNSS